MAKPFFYILVLKMGRTSLKQKPPHINLKQCKPEDRTTQLSTGWFYSIIIRQGLGSGAKLKGPGRYVLGLPKKTI